MADLTLKIESGEKELELVNAKRGSSVTVVVAVYDVFFLARIVEVAEALDGLQADLRAAAPGNADSPAQFADFYRKSKEIDRKMRDLLDGLFDAKVCDTLFPATSMFTVGGGAPTWCNVLYAIVDQMDDGLAGEKEKAQVRIRKYSEKYKK